LRDLQNLACHVFVAGTGSSRVNAQAAGVPVVDKPDQLPEVDGIVVAVPTSAHAEVTARVLARGMPVFVEKPLTTDAITARALAKSGDGRLFVMDKWRYHPGVEMLRDIAASGDLGKPVSVVLTRVGWGRPHPDVDPVWSLAPHDLSIALEILGHIPRPLAASGEIIDGLLWGVTAILGESPWVVLEASGAVHERRREIRLVCERGAAWLHDANASAVGIARGAMIGRSPEWRPITDELPLLRELRAFIEHLNGGPPPKSSATEGAVIVERIETIHALVATATA
jgi:predicted dehydrogenase